jgi:hypothetical protein
LRFDTPFATFIFFVMPEHRECTSHLCFFLILYLSLKDSHSFVLQALWADASKEEEQSVGAEDGHVFQLTPDCKIKHGTNHGQTPLYPQMLSKTKDRPNPPLLTTLELKDVSGTARAILLDFGSACLKV